MPGISPIKILGELLFVGAGHKRPDKDWKQPKSMQDIMQYSDALSISEKIAIPKQTPPWFQPKNKQKLHQGTCCDQGKAYKKLHDDCIDAVKFAVDMWKLQAKIQDLKVMAVSAIGSPGCLDGPELEDDIKNAPMVASYDEHDEKHRDAVAAGVSKCFKEWQDDVMVPGLPLYPAFAAFPGPSAPPMPNVPVPLIACPSSSMAKIIAPDDMKSAMIDAHDSDLKKKDKDKVHETLFESIATVLSLAFLMWLPSQQVMLVLGKGPIPTFAPPYVPVGPVVGGDNIAAPGHMIA